ncbi:MAG: methyltransferase domain-containing protein [Candidatus Aminicenantes bacterium]|nr:methyltransferase domain-containing protein [Candidatus Aminicenantes bacterium]
MNEGPISAAGRDSKWKVLAVDAKSARLEALRSIIGGGAEFYSARGLPEAFYWMEKLGTMDALILHHPAALSSRPKDLLQALHESLERPGDIIKFLIVDPRDESELRAWPYLSPSDVILTNGVSPAALWKEVRRRLAHREREKRSSLRVPFPGKKEIAVDTGAGRGLLIDLSETGMFVGNVRGLAVGQSGPFVIRVSGLEPIRAEGTVVRSDPEESGVGIAFRLLDETAGRAIFELLSRAVAYSDLEGLKERYPFLRTREMVPFQAPSKIAGLFREAMRTKADMMALLAQGNVRAVLALENLEEDRVCVFQGQELDLKFKTADPIFLSFHLGYATYNFETTVRRIEPDGRRMECFYPRVIFYSEKRSVPRQRPADGFVLEIDLPAPYNTKIRGPVADLSENGASVVLRGSGHVFLKGTPIESIRILDGPRLVHESRGEVRHAAAAPGESGPAMKIGIQFGIGRMNIEAIKAPPLDDFSDGGRTARRGSPAARRPGDFESRFMAPPEVVRFSGRKGETIVGLLNTSLPLDSRPVPVVLIPPAFGKTKETLSSLALSLAANFYLFDKPLAVLRFDGIRRKGESHKDPEAAEPPHEMINATYSQGAEDIVTALEWIGRNPMFTADRVILVTFSLAALEARLALRDPDVQKKFAYWIPCMGTPEIRQLMTRINCGLDLLEQYQLGINVGVVPILGNLVDIDRFAADGLRHRLASLDHAREDMRRIAVPVTWILGEHDHWVNPDFVRDIMGLDAGAAREVMTIPLGHNARSSEEALRLFGTIAALAYRFLHKESIRPVVPPRELLDHVRRTEKDRLPARVLPDRKAYWKRYLTGEEQCIGFDIFTLTDEYQQLMRDQLDALDPRPGESVLDLGGGTGNFVESLIRSGRPRPARVTIADLIPEALGKAMEKLSPFLAAGGDGGFVSAVVCDVEMNRYAPLRRFLSGEIASFRELADRVENLPLESAEKIQAAYTPRLHRLLRGEPLTPERESWLKSCLGPAEAAIIRDLNAAVRYVRGLAGQPPVYTAIRLPGDLGDNLHLPLASGSFDKVLMSLVLSYIFDPLESLIEIRRILRPGGRLVLSSMIPDTDASGVFTALVDKVERMPEEELPPQWSKRILLKSMRSFLNDAQALVELAEAGTFDFFDPEKLKDILDQAGWDCLGHMPTFGTPPQGYVIVARPRENHG